MMQQLKSNALYFAALVIVYIMSGFLVPGSGRFILLYLVMIMLIFMVNIIAAENVNYTVRNTFNATLPIIVIVSVIYFFDLHTDHYFVNNPVSLVVTWFAIMFSLHRQTLYRDTKAVLRRAQITASTGQAVQVPVPTMDFSASLRPTAPATAKADPVVDPFANSKKPRE